MNLGLFFEKAFQWTFCIFLVSIGLGRINLKDYHIPLSYGGSLENLMVWPLLFGFLACLYSKRDYWKPYWLPLGLVSLFLFWGLLQPWFTGNLGASNEERIAFFLGLVTFLLTLKAFQTPSLIPKLLMSLLIGTSIALLRGVIDLYYGIEHFELIGSESKRIVTPIGHPNFLGGYLVLVLPFAFLLDWNLWFQSWSKKWAVALGALFLIGCLLSYSRAAWLGLCIAFVVGGILLRKKWGMPLLWSFLLGLALYIAPFSFSETGQGKNPILNRLTSLKDIKTDRNVIERVYCWKNSLSIARDHLATGIGSQKEQFEAAFKEHRTKASLLVMPHAHNLFLHILVSFGIGGLILFSVLLFFGLKNAFLFHQQNPIFHDPPWNKVAFISLIGFICYGMFDFPLFSERVSPVFGLVLALCYCPNVLGYHHPDEEFFEPV